MLRISGDDVESHSEKTRVNNAFQSWNAIFFFSLPNFLLDVSNPSLWKIGLAREVRTMRIFTSLEALIITEFSKREGREP